MHINLVHDPIFFTCNKCEAKIKTKECLKYHIEKRHNNKKMFFFDEIVDDSEIKEENEEESE